MSANFGVRWKCDDRHPPPLAGSQTLRTSQTEAQGTQKDAAHQAGGAMPRTATISYLPTRVCGDAKLRNDVSRSVKPITAIIVRAPPTRTGLPVPSVWDSGVRAGGEHDEMSTTTGSLNDATEDKSKSLLGSPSGTHGGGHRGGNPLDDITHKSEPAMPSSLSRPKGLFDGGGNSDSPPSFVKPSASGLVTRSLPRDRGGGGHDNCRMGGAAGSPDIGHRTSSSRSSSRVVRPLVPPGFHVVFHRTNTSASHIHGPLSPAFSPCHVCFKRFLKKQNLRVHLKTHSDERKFDDLEDAYMTGDLHSSIYVRERRKVPIMINRGFCILVRHWYPRSATNLCS